MAHRMVDLQIPTTPRGSILGAERPSSRDVASVLVTVAGQLTDYPEAFTRFWRDVGSDVSER